MFGNSWLSRFYGPQMSVLPQMQTGGGFPPQQMQPFHGPDTLTPHMPAMNTGGNLPPWQQMNTGGQLPPQALPPMNTGGVLQPQQLPQMNTGGPGQVQGFQRRYTGPRATATRQGGLAGLFNGYGR